MASPRRVADSKESPPSPSPGSPAENTRADSRERAEQKHTEANRGKRGSRCFNSKLRLESGGVGESEGRRGEKTTRLNRRFGEATLRVVNGAGCVSEGFFFCDLLRQSAQIFLVEYFQSVEETPRADAGLRVLRCR